MQAQNRASSIGGVVFVREVLEKEEKLQYHSARQSSFDAERSRLRSGRSGVVGGSGSERKSVQFRSKEEASTSSSAEQ